MEESMESSINRDINLSINSLSSSSSAESGWTLYFEEFLASQKEERKKQNTSSMVSDATSHFPGKFREKSQPSVSSKRLISLKKRKAKGVSFFNDHPLEDTASSPVNSPKVSGIGDYLDMNGRKKDDIISISEGNEKGIDSEKCAEVKREVFDGLGSVDSTIELTELKKKGLCLVPLSMLVDFLGH